jgi:hypothetical protein
MKRVIQYHFLILMLALVLFSCKKEYSLENVQFQGNAIYSLQDSAGNCTTADVHGTYKADSTLSDSSYVNIHVNFTTTGKYYFTSDTVNGLWFIDSGYALVTGPAVIKLKGYGQPILPVTSSYLINNNAKGCGFSITAASADDYLPSTNASTWRFQYVPAVLSTGGAKIDSFDVTVTPPTITYNSRTYIQYATSLLDTFYFAKQSNDYYEFGTPDFDYTFVFDKVDNFAEYIYLKTNQPVGTTWESITPVGVSYGAAWGLTSKTGLAKDVFTIVEVNLPHTVAGITFQNVIGVRRDIMFQETGTTNYIKEMDGIAWYAKGVGLIDQAINLPGGKTENIPLIRFTIK